MNPEELLQKNVSHQLTAEAHGHDVRVCMGAGCMSLHSDQIKSALTAQVKQHGRDKSCHVKGVGCMGLCAAGPLVSVEPQGVLYKEVTEEDAGEIIDSLNKAPVARLICPTDTPFFQNQMKIVLENCGKIDPERIEEYVNADGYIALIKALTEMTPNDVITQVMRSGLRGRGGGGYPTGLKWTTVAKADGTQKYVICNGDEGDPGAFMDRGVMEGDPHRLIEAMAIAGYAVGADTGYIFVRGEYSMSVKRLRKAIMQAERQALLGKNIFNTPFSFQIEVRIGAGAFVSGEETALIACIEGRRGVPSPRPPYPAERGLWGCPTLINNVETLANIPSIIRNGADWFSNIGTRTGKGTVVFAMTGRVQNTGLIEVPMGTPLREVIFDIGGGVPDGGTFKAVQMGGPSGGCIPEQYLDMPIDFDSLLEIGAIMGSGGMLVIDDSASMVDMAKFFMEFCRIESCGKCVPCRVGTVQMHELLIRFSEGTATERDLVLLEELCDLVRHTSLCGLGQSAPNPVLSTLRYFRHEYMAQIRPDFGANGVDTHESRSTS
ncbi:MAG: NADH-quinone oxidoreductase subunit L [Chloroflexaceae bacterium]|nr:NADH-quinone oxidoreductase subunit L [Chloroflexaceae bacterium]NJO06119.1 NADH-quinone oxidoreductase subunit L [Chloroflexaceae bacterium]